VKLSKREAAVFSRQLTGLSIHGRNGLWIKLELLVVGVSYRKQKTAPKSGAVFFSST